MAVQGFEGTVDGRDSRYVPVIAATRRVDGTPWFLVAKIDREEALGSIRERAILIGAVLLLLVVAWLTGMMLTVSLLPVTPWASVVYVLFAGQVAMLLRRVGAFRWYTAVLYPVPLIFFFAVFTRSALRSGKQVMWKGRQIRAD
jgi:hypothetical protein